MLKIQNVTKKFGKFTAVKNLNLNIKEGEVFGLLGRNWAWKTTTIKMITGILKPTEGQILFDDKTIFDHPIEVKKQLAYIPDTPFVYEKLTGIEFLLFIGNLRGISASEVQKRAQPLIKLFDLNEMITKKTEEFSHWMRQKLVFIAAILHKPKYLIVDEPMVGLDPQSARAIKDMFKLLAHQKKTTIILTTHQLNVAQEVCDRVWIIHQWELKYLFENKKDFEKDLEEKFLELTGAYDKDLLLQAL